MSDLVNTAPPSGPDVDKVLAALDPEEILALTRDILAIQSHREAPGQETPVATLIRDFFIKEGIDAELREVLDGRCNVIATLPGTGGGPSLMLNGHTDTVPPGRMERPFEPHIVDGKLFARGACDMKAGVAGEIAALIALKRAGVKLKGDLIFAGVIAEEDGTSWGTLDILENGPVPDMAVVAEPSDLKVIVAHKGFDYYRIEVTGVPAHSSEPSNGVSAVYGAARIVSAVEDRLIPLSRQRSHPLLGSASINVSAIVGYARNEEPAVMHQDKGAKPLGATVPDVCTIYMDRRRIPGETLELVQDEMDGWLEVVKGEYGVTATARFTAAGTGLASHPPLDTSPDHPLVRHSTALAASLAGVNAGATGVPFWSDAALFNDMKNIPAIVLGPGNIGSAHSDREFVPVDEVVKAARIYALLALSLLGSSTTD